MNVLKVSLCLLASVLFAASATISGKWGGTAQVKLPSGESRSYTLELQMTQKGPDVSGTIGTGEGDGVEIQKGKFEGTRLSFEVTPPEAGSPVKFELDLNGDRLEGQLKGEVEGGAITGKIALTRAR